MARAWDGTLTAAEFEKATLHLVEVWGRQCPHLPPWMWQKSLNSLKSQLPAPVAGYLVLQDVHVKAKYKDVESIDEFHEVDDEPEDLATMDGCPAGEEEHWYTYHVVYNESYRVPMLFLHGRLPDGRPLQWHNVLGDLPVGSQQVSEESRWTFLTQEDHPFLHRPWFALHPCGTSAIMSLVYSDPSPAEREIGRTSTEDLKSAPPLPDNKSPQESSCESVEGALLQRNQIGEILGGQSGAWREKYILTWLSFACPAVGLTIPSCVFSDGSYLWEKLVGC